MPNKKTVDEMRVSRANFYFSIVVVAIIAIMIFLNT
jgi:hypothetical protein